MIRSGTEKYQVGDYIFEVEWKKKRDMKNTAIHKDSMRVPSNCTTTELMEWYHRQMIKTLVLHMMGWKIQYTISSRCIAWTIPLGKLSKSEDLSATVL